MRSKLLLPLSLAVTAALSLPAAASAAYPHVVTPGESLYSVAAADGLSVAQLAAANGISSGAPLSTGATLLIPPQNAAGSSTAAASPSSIASATAGDGDADRDDGVGTAAVPAGTAAGSTGPAGVITGTAAGSATSGYVVQPGDTLSAIAARAGISVAELAAANGLDPSGLLIAGHALRLSGGGSGTTVPVSTTVPASSASSPSAAGQPVGAAAQGVASAPPYPTPERVSASQIGQIASAHGVSPSLAAAIGWQESGFNNDLVSTADARGVMQILPGTWDWIQRTLTAGTPLAPASAADNVRGGVLLLHSLLSSTGGDPALAAAGYYQGLSSVRAHGLYSDTQNYVNSVLSLRQHFGGP